MNAGLFKHRITIQALTATKDEEGQQIQSWTDYAIAKAYVNGLSGSEYWAAQAIQAENTVVFSVRYTQKIAAIIPQEYRIVFGGAVYDIKNVDNVQYQNNVVKIKAVKKNG